MSLGIRVLGIETHGLNNDELASFAWIQTPTLLQLWREFWNPHEGNTIGYAAFLRLWTMISTSESWLRLPAALGGAGLVASVFLALRQVTLVSNPWAAALAVSLGASEFLLYYSQQARCYSLFALAVFLSWWSAHLWVHGSRRARWVWLASATSALWLHHFGILYIGVLALIFGLRRKSWMWFAPFLLFLPHLPLTWFQLQNGPVYLPAPTWNNLSAIASALLRWPGSTGGAVVAMALFGWFRRKANHREALIAAVAVPGAILAATLFYKSLIAERYLIPSVPLLFMGVAGWVSGRKDRALPGCVAALGIWATVLSWQNVQTTPGADFRETARWIVEHESECGRKIVTHSGLVTKWRYYLPERFELLSWETNSPLPPLWVAWGHYPMPEILTPFTQSRLSHTGRDTMAACIYR